MAHVLEVQAVGRLVDDKDATRATRLQRHGVLLQARCHLEALQLATRQGTERLVQVQIMQTHVHHGLQLLLDARAFEEFTSASDRQIHHLSDVHAVDGILQCFRRVTQAMTGLAGGLDVIHEGHLGDDHALAAAHGATALAIKRKVLFLDLVGLGKALADIRGNVHIGSRG